MDSNNNPVSLVNIELVEESFGTSSDKDGFFILKNIEKNSIKIKLTHISFHDKIISISKDSQNIIYLDFKIDKMDEIIVTGLRREIYIKDSPILTRVINSNDIENSSYSNVKDILEMSIPNVQNVISSHAGISNNNLKVQGLDNRYMLFLLDGERVSGEFAGNLDFNMLDLSNVERIEIVEGGMSSLYGSSAIGGVVNIITKSNQDPFNIKFSYLNEDPMIISQSVNMGLKYKFINYNINLVEQKTDGYSLSPRPDDLIGAIYKTQEEYLANSVSHILKLNYKHNLNTQSYLKLNYKEYINTIRQYENHRVMILDQDDPLYPQYLYQSYINNTPRFKDYRFGFNYILKSLYSEFKLSFNSENYRKYNFFFNYEELQCDEYGNNCNQTEDLIQKEIINASNKNQNFSIQYNYVYDNHDLIAGYEINNDEYSSFNVYRYDHNNDGQCGSGTIWDPNDCWSKSIFDTDDTKFYKKNAFFIGDQITLNNNKLNTSIRYTNSKNFGNGLVYSFSYINKNINPKYNYRFNYSKGFRTPSIKELYYNFQSHPPPVIGNINLKPTTNYYLSLSIDKRENKYNFSFDFFYNNVIDMIGIISTQDELNNEILQYSNYNNVILKGLNVHFEKLFNDNNKLKAFYNYTLPTSNNNTALELISKHTIRLSIQKKIFKKFKIISNIKYLSSKDIYLGSQKIILDDYILWELISSTKISKYIDLKIGIKNIFDYKDDRRLLESNQEILTSYDPGRRLFIQFNLKK